MPTRAPVSEFEFILNEIIDYEQIIKTSRFKDTSSELVSQILSEAARRALGRMGRMLLQSCAASATSRS